MLDMLFGGDAFQAATAALNAAALRQQVIANNLANVNTPGYKRQAVSFESALQSALEIRHTPFAALDPHPISSIQPTVYTVNTTTDRTDGNNVDPESESVALAMNAIRYDALATAVSLQFTNLKTVINGR
ncbi:MAG TPA: flagellar basal body rod protein FlgB [Chthonomonas sp.]|uniref:flagellar basal body rod protein FlgB n=1 Tax=Chthonomonas sp. TaxID=2282153 RepID=UPI002B4B7C77|nr:flagellar basal body rod protein FlgB [Chthonomonas sp.]HLI48323.1 flagellar basal body rod protein FlgB [Chthonomonas sp.]